LQSLTGPNRSTQSLNQIIQSPPKPLTLLVAEIADVKQSVLELPSELRAAALLQPLHQVSKPGLERYTKPGAQAIGPGRKAVNLARLRREQILLQSNRVSLRDPLNDPPFSSAFCEIAMGYGDVGSGDIYSLKQSWAAAEADIAIGRHIPQLCATGPIARQRQSLQMGLASLAVSALAR
jgi:hypothetical protein